MSENTRSDYFVIFITHHLYYLPQFLPVARELKKRGKSCLFLLMGKDLPPQNDITESFLQANGYDYTVYNSRSSNEISCRFLISGANQFNTYNIPHVCTGHIVHGIGTKVGYYTEEQNLYDIRFVEGQYRADKIRELFPDVKTKLFNVGFAKLDSIFDYDNEMKKELLNRMNLDERKPTILYAPTFYPSSIDKMPIDFPQDFNDYNLIIKPHFFSFQIKTYKHHLRIFDHWKKYANVYFAGVEEFNLVPFLAMADIMISDESSAIFEFAALDKPVICNRNVKYRWTYLLFKFKIRKRMDAQMDPFRDVATSVFRYDELLPAVKYELTNPSQKAIKRKEISNLIVGQVDGKVSERIVDVLESWN